MAPTSCAEVLTQTLRSAGVTRVFGHPGGEVLDLIQAVEEGGIEFVLTGHESAAAFLAGTVGRMTGIPGVCLSTLGPGACNLVLGVAAAYLDRDPLLAISARTPSSRALISNKQNLRLNDLFSPVTKRSIALTGAGTAETVCHALGMAAAPPRGPVYLSLPADVAAAPERPAMAGGHSPASLPKEVRQLDVIQSALNRARRPVGLVGIALDAAADHQQVRRFFASCGIPFAATPQAKGIADETSEYFLGTVGAGAADNLIVDWLSRSDCLLGVGFDPVESSQDWHFTAPLYSLANAPVGFGDYAPAAESVGSVRWMLEELLSGQRGGSEWTLSEMRQLRGDTRALLCPHAPESAAGLSPFHVAETLRQALPPATILATDVGAHKMLLTQAWYAPEPGSFLVSNGLSAMGYGVPAAIAAALLQPNRPVIGVIGDGGMGMMAQELETAARLEVRPLLVVFCDRSLAIIKLAQKTRGLPERGVDFAPVNWARVAEGFGAAGLVKETLAGIREAVEEWLAHPRLTVLAVPIDPALYAGLSY